MMIFVMYGVWVLIILVKILDESNVILFDVEGFNVVDDVVMIYLSMFIVFVLLVVYIFICDMM